MQARKIKNYINGRWQESEATAYLDVQNPSTEEIIAQVPMTGPNETARAIEAAHDAFHDWKNTAASKRVACLYRLLDKVIRDEEKISRILVQEMGKSLTDAVAEMKRVIENIQAACSMPLIQQGDVMTGCSEGIDGTVLRLPLGVFTLIAPFNFPVMVPFWFIPYALASGNTYVAKPSELVPLTMEYITQLIDEAGFPPGVFNLINGGKEAGETFITHPKVAGVSMVGSTTTGRIIASGCAKHGKRYQVMGGAKNHLVVMPDADIENTVRNMITSCFGCAGQRCMAASVIVCVGDDTHKVIRERFTQAAKAIKASDPLDPAAADDPTVMGPVINAAAKDRIINLIGKGESEGAELLLDGRKLNTDKGYFFGPTIFDGVKAGMEIHTTEIFGPVVCIMKVDTLEEAVAVINSHRYGNGASIYTSDGYSARYFKIETQAGMIGINVGIPAPVAFLPFGGMKDSLFSDIKAQGKSVVNFFTDEKIITERYWKKEI
jgi:malonate-semialdehyde dehydrogenase (acetylating)/methylmalonate-semialdehyde dehydrogenase